MITIENLDKKTKGECKYLLKVGDKEILTFIHDRSRGLAVCLREAAEAVIKKERGTGIHER